jgi:hypothetical protein
MQTAWRTRISSIRGAEMQGMRQRQTAITVPMADIQFSSGLGGKREMKSLGDTSQIYPAPTKRLARQPHLPNIFLSYIKCILHITFSIPEPAAK